MATAHRRQGWRQEEGGSRRMENTPSSGSSGQLIQTHDAHRLALKFQVYQLSDWERFTILSLILVQADCHPPPINLPRIGLLPLLAELWHDIVLYMPDIFFLNAPLPSASVGGIFPISRHGPIWSLILKVWVLRVLRSGIFVFWNKHNHV